ncbi:unnamed protein product, partial [Mesorhabditis spiculigera]
MVSTNEDSKIRKFIHHRQINIIITTLLIFVSTYIALVTCLGENIFNPIGNVTEPAWPTVNTRDVINSTISTFFIVVFGLIAGRLCFLVHLPPLLGSLIIGIALKNIPGVNEWLIILPSWDAVLRKLAFALIMIRCSMGINLAVVRANPRILVSLGCIAPLVEALCIFVAAHFIFSFPVSLSLVFGFLLAANSPAVTVPSMLHFQNTNHGTAKGIPTLVLACASADNVLLIVAYTVSIGLVFASGSLFATIAYTIGEIVASAAIGIFLGWLLWYFPRKKDTYTHLARGIVLVTLSLALLFSAIRLDIEFTGSISLVAMCLTAAIRWKTNSEKQTRLEQRVYAVLWDLIFQPVLFVLIGMKFEISELSWHGILIGLACLGIGLVGRAIAVILLTVGAGLTMSEQLIFVFSFVPKATVQAALAPGIVVAAAAFPELLPQASIVLSACVVAILLTAPLGQLALGLFGPKFLTQDTKRPPTPDEFYGSVEELGPEQQPPRRSSSSSTSRSHRSSPRKIYEMKAPPPVEEQD